MLVRDLYSLSLHNLLLHKVRSLLTSLGIIFGVGSVIAMLAISGGAKKEAIAQIEAMGINNIIVYTKTGQGPGGPENAGTRVLEYGMTHIDLKNIRKMENIEHVTTVRNVRAKIVKGITPLDVELFWVSPHFIDDINSRVIRGRWFAPSDYKSATTVCVIGKNVKRKIFSLGEKDVMGKTIRVSGGAFKIVGIMENNTGTKLEGMSSLNDSIYIPSTTGREMFTEYARITGAGRFEVHHVEHDLFIVRVTDPQIIDHTSKRIIGLLRKTHKDKDWGVSVPLNLLRQKEATQNIFTVVMGSIAAISLVVGGIGIMNIMLANVYERRKEIGTRRAIGAKKRDILFQFLIETVFLTVIGGLFGIALGIGLAASVTHFSGMPSVVSLWSVVGSITISGIIGVVFGTYPAWQAANQDPIKALRAE
jgi:putative ABC transport system permease protein